MSRDATMAVSCNRRRLLTNRSLRRTREFALNAFDDDPVDDVAVGEVSRSSFSVSNEVIVAMACGRGKLVAVAQSLTAISAVSLNNAKTPTIKRRTRCYFCALSMRGKEQTVLIRTARDFVSSRPCARS